ncbi:MAG: DNA-directed RNA polymerase sigma-70 factor [Myxococcaceae bacterium]
MLNSAAMGQALSHTGTRDAVLALERPRLEALARRLVWDEEDARDVLQASLADAVERWPDLKDEARAAAWLRRIVVHRAWSHLRRRRFWQVVAVVLRVDEAQVAPSPDEAVEQRAHLEALGRGLSQLAPRQAMAFSLRYLEGLSLDEVAEAMALEKGTVRVHLQRAVRALRDMGLLPARGQTGDPT